MVHAYHAIFAAYGFWLPNDPRGSWSQWVGAWELLKFGNATTTNVRHSVAAAVHDREARQTAKRALKYPPVVFTGRQALCVAKGFELAATEANYRIYACAIMPEHVHVVIGRHEERIEQMVQRLKSRATKQLNLDDLHPLKTYPQRDGSLHTPWTEGRWKVFLNDPAAIVRAIRYVESNPIKEGKRHQHWSFVTPFVGT